MATRSEFRSRRRLLGIALGIAIALGAVWVTWRTPSATEADADPTDQPEEVHDAAWSVAPQSEALTIPVAVSPPQRFDDAASGAPSADQPLPPHDTPLTEVIDELESRALRGDRPAACRLAMDGYFCRNNPLDSDSVAFFEQAIASRGRTTAADVAWIERLEAMHRRAVRLCSGLPEGWVRDHSWRYLLQGAQLGDDFLAAMYVIAPPLDRNDFLENPEPWSQYQQHAATLLRRAAEHGELRAIWQLQRIHSGRGALIGMPHAIVPNRRLAAVYAVALRQATTGDSLREFDTYARRHQSDFDAEAWRAIEREGAVLAQGHFSGLAPLDLQRGVFGEVDSRRCEASGER